MRFWGAVLRDANAGIDLVQLSLRDALSEGQILVRLDYAGICGRQIDEVKGYADTSRFFPHLLGHEGVGQVVDTWAKDSKFQPGQNVILHWRCSEGREGVPARYWDEQGRQINAGWVTTFNEYAVVSENRATLLIDEVESWMPLLGCALPTGMGSVFFETQVSPRTKPLVVGTGGVGLFVLEALRIKGVTNPDYIEVSSENVKLAHDLNFTARRDSLESLPDKEYDIIFLTTSNQGIIKESDRLLRHGGHCHVIGPPHDMQGKDLLAAMRNGLSEASWEQSDGGGFLPELHLPRYLRLIQSGAMSPIAHVSRLSPLSQIKGIFAEVSRKPRGRIILSMMPLV